MIKVLFTVFLAAALAARAETNSVAALSAQWDEAASAMRTPVENLTLPAEYHPNGRVKVMLHAKRAQMISLDVIFARGVHFDLYDEKGAPDGSMDMDDCLFNRKSGEGYCRGRVNLVYGSDKLKGVGLYFRVEPSLIRILAACEIRTARMPAKLGI